MSHKLLTFKYECRYVRQVVNDRKMTKINSMSLSLCKVYNVTQRAKAHEALVALHVKEHIKIVPSTVNMVLKLKWIASSVLHAKELGLLIVMERMNFKGERHTRHTMDEILQPCKWSTHDRG